MISAMHTNYTHTVLRTVPVPLTYGQFSMQLLYNIAYVSLLE